MLLVQGYSSPPVLKNLTNTLCVRLSDDASRAPQIVRGGLFMDGVLDVWAGADIESAAGAREAGAGGEHGGT